MSEVTHITAAEYSERPTQEQHVAEVRFTKTAVEARAMLRGEATPNVQGKPLRDIAFFADADNDRLRILTGIADVDGGKKIATYKVTMPGLLSSALAQLRGKEPQANVVFGMREPRSGEIDRMLARSTDKATQTIQYS